MKSLTDIQNELKKTQSTVTLLLPDPNNITSLTNRLKVKISRLIFNSIASTNPYTWPNHKVTFTQTKINDHLVIYQNQNLDQNNPDILYLHGGAYFMGGIKLHKNLIQHIGHTLNANIVFPEYRLSPEHFYPAQLDDALASYQWMLNHGINAKNIIIMGDSAGGHLAMTLNIELKAQKLPKPCCSVLLSPMIDTTCSGESSQENMHQDYIIGPYFAKLIKENKNYETGGFITNGEQVMKNSDQKISLLNAKVDGLAPICIHVSDSECLLDDSVTFANNISQAKGQIELEISKGCPHVWQLFQCSESIASIKKINTFIHKHWVSGQRKKSA